MYKINSSCLNIITPQKCFIQCVESTPVKIGKVPQRFCPSYSVKTKLKQIERVHGYRCHMEVDFETLKELNISRKEGEEIVEFLLTADIPDIITKLEIIAIDKEFFNQDVKEYLSEEFDCDPEFSFSIICIFHYMSKLKVGLAAAITELFKLSHDGAVCIQCIDHGGETSESQKAVEFYNFRLLQSLSWKDSAKDDISCSDDSKGDPDFGCDEHSSDDDCTDDDGKTGDSTFKSDKADKTSNRGQQLKPASVSNPFMSPEKHSDTFEFNDGEESSTAQFQNPFMSSTESETEFSRFSPNANSTAFFKPSSSSNKIENVLNSSVKSLKCEHCPKQFSNRNNMKLHIIRYFMNNFDLSVLWGGREWTLSMCYLRVNIQLSNISKQMIVSLLESDMTI